MAAPKKGIALLLGMGKPMSGEKGDEGDGEDMDLAVEAKRAAASEAFDALKEDDREAFSGALERFVRACMRTDYESEEEGGEEG
jgi:hypothetical protein